MFFGKTKRIASAVSEAILSEFRLAFKLTKYVNKETGQISFPFDFFSDQYILGFITGYVSSMVVISHGGNDMSLKQRDDILFHMWEHLAGRDARQAMLLTSKVNAENSDQYEVFFQGYDEASYYVCTRLGMKLREGIDVPVLEEARKMAPSLHGLSIDLSLPEGRVDTSTSMASALFLLTLKKHVDETYLR